jgi:CRISPR-associated protein Csd1
MILRRLCEAAPQFEFPPFGYQEGPIKWLVSLDSCGRLIGCIPTVEEGTRKSDRGKRMLFPFTKRTSQVAPQLLADKADYALGLVSPDASNRDKAQSELRHRAFVALLSDFASATAFGPAIVVLTFLRQGPHEWPDDMEPGDMVTFEVDARLLIDEPEVRGYWAARVAALEERGHSGTCLVCGRERAIADPHPLLIKRVPGGQSSGCALVSVNADAFDSYGHKKGLSQAPVCWDCARSYAEVLGALLADPRHHYTIQDRVAWVFWTRKPSSFDPNSILFAPRPEDIRDLLDGVQTGVRQELDDNEAFYALALSGSGGRVVFRDWLESTVPRVQANLARYFESLAIVDYEGGNAPPIGLYALLGSTLPTKSKDPWKDLSPNLAAQLVRAVLTNGRIPQTVLDRAVCRARAEQGVTRPRAALIKLCLLYAANQKEGINLTVDLNRETDDTAYLCGRLFAVLESVQRAAIPGAKQTVTDRYYGAASSAPASVFGSLLRQTQGHLAKLRKTKEGAYFRLEQTLEEVLGRLSAFPRTLTLADQGLFALGYYQQKASERASMLEAAARKAGSAAQPNPIQGDEDE